MNYVKIQLGEGVVIEQQSGEDEGTHGLHEAISSLQYINASDVKHFLNYPSENDAVMESPTDEEIIQEIIYKIVDDDHDLDDSCVFTKCFPKRGVSSYCREVDNGIINVE